MGATVWLRREALNQLTRVVDARTGVAHPERVHAQWSAHDFAVFSSVLTVGYLAYYLVIAESWATPLVVTNILGLAGHVSTVMLARVRRQLAAALTTLLTSMTQIVVAVLILGWESGIHLYLISGGVLVFVVFTERQAPWRWLFIAAAAATFIGCQTLASGSSERHLSTGALAVMFSINAVLTALLVYALSGLAYHRANRARAQAATAAARAETMANTDVLTGLVNRRPIIATLESESLLGGYAVAIADLDRFKLLNDTYGHQCGDVVLVEVAQLLRGRLRAADSVGRWGGEEFILVLPSTTADEGVALAEQLRALIESSSIACHGHTHSVTVSIGVADGVSDGTSHGVVKRADEALYDAKMAGRNAVRVRGISDPRDPTIEEERRASRTARSRRRATG